MHETLDIFEGGMNQTMHYHGMFNSTYFIAWMEKLLAALGTRNVQNCVIIMDDAKYHKSFPEGTPKSQWKNQELVDFCEAEGTPFLPIDLKTAI